jgi:long-chain acyl-CoA synthetase
LHNNQDPYTTCLVHPNADAVKRFLKSRDIDPATDEAVDAVIELIDQEIRAYRSSGKYGNMFPQRWIPATVGLLSEGFTIENKLMNPTYKIIRPKITEHYEKLLAFLYTPEAKNIGNARNREEIRKLLS